MSALAALRDHHADLVKACPAMSGFLAAMAGDTEIGRAATRRASTLQPGDLRSYPPLLRMPYFVRAAIDATETAIRGLERNQADGLATSMRMIAAARRMASGGRVMGPGARQDFLDAIRNRRKDDSITMAAAFTADAANALACVKSATLYQPLDADVHDLAERGFPGAFAAGCAIGFAWAAAPTQGARGTVMSIAQRAVDAAIAPGAEA